jgi:hypothetical protein
MFGSLILGYLKYIGNISSIQLKIYLVKVIYEFKNKTTITINLNKNRKKFECPHLSGSKIY